MRAVPGKRLEYAVRSRGDLEAIEKYYLEVAGDVVADRVVDAILSQAEKIAALGLMFRPGIRDGTRECVMTRYSARGILSARAVKPQKNAVR